MINIMNFAIIKTGGKQIKVAKGDLVKVEKINGKSAFAKAATGKEGDKVEFKDVLLVKKGNALKIGQPLVKGAKVEAKIINQGRGRKIVVFKYKSKKRYKKKKGHRQSFTQVEILKISA